MREIFSDLEKQTVLDWLIEIIFFLKAREMAGRGTSP